MSGIRFGTTPVTARYLGVTPINRTYVGTNLVWSRSGVITQPIRDDFNRPDGPLGSKWTDHGDSIAPLEISVVNNAARLEIPDDPSILVPYQISRKRYNAAVAASSDYRLEIRVGSRGNGVSPLGQTHWTRVYARLSNSAFTHGVGIQVASSRVWIVRLVAGNGQEMVDCGNFAADDVIRLRGVGNEHVLAVNGDDRDGWSDSGNTAAEGAGYLSLGIEQTASKAVGQPRLFSPSLDYVELR